MGAVLPVARLSATGSLGMFSQFENEAPEQSAMLIMAVHLSLAPAPLLLRYLALRMYCIGTERNANNGRSYFVSACPSVIFHLALRM